MADPVLVAEDISKSYLSKKNGARLTILEDAYLKVGMGDSVSIIGSSGSGKSTLLHILGGLDHPDNGTVKWRNQTVTGMNDEQLTYLRNRSVGFVFQFHHLLPEFSAVENVFMPALIRGDSQKEATEKAMDLLDRLRIGDRASHRPSELSGGEQQRVAVARALINKPDMILADEPTGNLDETNTDILLDILFDLNKQENVTLILVTHEAYVARRASKQFELKNGQLHKI